MLSMISGMGCNGLIPQSGELQFASVSTPVVDDRVRGALEFMAGHLGEHHLHMREIARHLAISESHLQRLFRREAGGGDGRTQAGSYAAGRAHLEGHAPQCEGGRLGGWFHRCEPFCARLQEAARSHTAGLSGWCAHSQLWTGRITRIRRAVHARAVSR